MTDYSQLIKELQSHTLVGGHSTCLEWEAADAIEALEARVAELEAKPRVACTVCKTTDPTHYTRCQYPGCTDGRML